MNADFFATADSLEKVFWTCAIAGTLFFVLRIIMLMIGGDFDANVDGDVTSGTHFDSSDEAFGIISINSITAFFMMFGWVGLTCYKQFEMGIARSTLLAFFAGVLCMLFTAYLFKMSQKLTSKGSQFDIHKTVGLNATVEQRISKGGRGRITVSIEGNMSRHLDAISENKQQIDSFKIVQIVRIIDSNTVSVKLLSE